MLLMPVEANSQFQTKELEVIGKLIFLKPIGLTESDLGIEETAVVKDLQAQLYTSVVSYAAKLRLELRMANGILSNVNEILEETQSH